MLKPMIVCSPTPRVSTNSVCPPVTSTPKKGNSAFFDSAWFPPLPAYTSLADIIWPSRCDTGIRGRSCSFASCLAYYIPSFKDGTWPGPIVTAIASRSEKSETLLFSSAYSTTTGRFSLWCNFAYIGASLIPYISCNVFFSLARTLPQDETTPAHESSKLDSIPRISLFRSSRSSPSFSLLLVWKYLRLKNSDVFSPAYRYGLYRLTLNLGM